MSSIDRPVAFATVAIVERSRSVSKGPGRRLLIVTLCATVLRASPAMKPVSPARAPLERPRMSIGDFTETDVMFTIRPKCRAIMPSTVALIRKIGVSMLASSARTHASRSHSRKSPGGGPPALFTRMSGLGHAWSSCARTASFVRAFIVMFTPSRASDMAQPLPSPLLAAQTIASLPLIPRSMVVVAPLEKTGRDERPADRLALGAAHRGQRRPDVSGRDAPEQDERFLHPVVHVHEGRGVE